MNVSLHYKELKAELSMGSQACNRLLSKQGGGEPKFKVSHVHIVRPPNKQK